MTDDIVIRLRKAHEEAKQWIEGGRWLCPKTIHSEAADEIERLRKEVARLGAFLHPVGMVVNTEHGAVIPKAGIEGVTDEEVNEYLKVVRGD